MLFKVLRRVCLLILNIRQRRRKWEVHSLQSGLNNFGNYTWICAHVNRLTLGGAVWNHPEGNISDLYISSNQTRLAIT